MVKGQGRRFHPDCFAFIADLPPSFEVRILVEEDWQPFYSGDWLARLAVLRTRALNRVTAPYWMCLDGDCILTAEAVIEGVAWLEEYPAWGGVAYWTEACEPPVPLAPMPHIPMRCSLFRSEATEGIVFTTTRQNRTSCECACFCEDIRERGWIYEYHPDLITVPHLSYRIA